MMNSQYSNGYSLFETPLGVCGIAWRIDAPHAVTCFQLPEATVEQTEARIARHCGRTAPSEPPASIVQIMEMVRRHLAGELQEFKDIEVDFGEAAPFAKSVYEAIRRIPAGELKTYGELAAELQQPQAAQAVGQVLGRNPIPLIVPCHRIVAAGGRPGGFSAPGGLQTKAKLLEIEGASWMKAPVTNQIAFDFGGE
jgi:methylated-DNA-[protein]-cysteine S-methyltransferase